MSHTYPGNGACELCGHTDPCDYCVGAPAFHQSLGERTASRPTEKPKGLSKKEYKPDKRFIKAVWDIALGRD